MIHAIARLVAQHATHLANLTEEPLAGTGSDLIDPVGLRLPQRFVRCGRTTGAAGQEGTGTCRLCGTCSTGCSASSTTLLFDADRNEVPVFTTAGHWVGEATTPEAIGHLIRAFENTNHP